MTASSNRFTSPKSSPTTSPRARHPSISKSPISWLSKHSLSGHSRTESLSCESPITISEPKLVQDSYGFSTYSPSTRFGALGSGATIIRTPEQAQSRMARYPPVEVPETVKDDDESSSYDEDEPPSPPLPPLPFISKSTSHLPILSEMGEIVPDRSYTPSPAPKTSRAGTPVTPPHAKPVLKQTTTSQVPPTVVPILPLNISPTPPQPAFSPILLSSPPSTLIDLSTLMVGIETSSSSMRTTYATLTSRSSYLASYLESLARAVHQQQKSLFRDSVATGDTEQGDHAENEDDEEDAHRLPSPDTPFASLFSAHLASVGLFPHSASLINIFLDRPSAPYPHILTYLRQPTTSSATLPRAVALGPRHTHIPERIEALLELRDEAKYLGLEELHRLCCDELRQRAGGHARTGSAGLSDDVFSSRGRTLGASTHMQQGHAVVSRIKEPLPPVSTMTAAAMRTSDASSVEAVAMARAQTPSSRRSEARAHSQARSSEGWI